MAHEGTVVAGRFEIERVAGRGGMGMVYRARDRSTTLPCAVKILHDEAVASHRDRFTREARLLAELTHPAFVRYLDFGTTDDGRPYLAMEWLDGEDLATRLRRTGLTASESVKLAGRVAAALGAAHGRGIVHRDIKPSNLFLVDCDVARVKVLDFGVARIQSTTDAMTRTGTAIGTPRYMAPEQARGARDIDARADVFSLGCVLFECLAGHPPFGGQNPAAVLAKILMEDAPRLSTVRDDLPSALDDLLARMLAKDPAGRPRDGAGVAAELEAIGEMPAGERDAVPQRSSAVTIGEQRLVCVVYAAQAIEVHEPTPPSGAFTMVEDSAPETATSSATDRRLRAVAGVATAHGGKIEVLADGSVFVTVFGQGAATDQAARAARCALAIREVVPEAPMALAIGRSVVGDQVPLGELIDRATGMIRTAAIEPATARRPIRVDEVAAGLLDVRFAIAGDEHGLALAGERDVADLARTLLGKPTPCVGRERELGTLLAIFEECVAEPRAHAVVVTAPPGVGKSRLRHEMLRRVEDRAIESSEPVEIWIGRGDSMSVGAPFGLLAEALRRTCGILDGEPLVVKHMKLRARVGRHVPPDIAPRVTEFLGELVGAPVPTGASVALRAARQSPELIGDQMLRACEDFLAAECAAQPVLLVLEDLQWGDLPTVRFVDAILRQLPDQPLMVLALARPEVDSLFPRLWADRGVERMHLGELSRKAAEKLVRDTLGGGIDAAIVARLVERAAGNAFYLEELIRSVSEGYGERLPETIIAMAQARIEALEPEARHVLRAASVYGQTFWKGGVEALLESSTTQVTDWLTELVARELITARRECRFAYETEYTFRHALVREAAYAMLTDRDRTLGHRLAGEWLEAHATADRTLSLRAPRPEDGVRGRAADVDAVELAEHFLRGGEPRRASVWYRQSAEQALEGDDLASAIDRAERAIACIRAVGDTGNREEDQLVGVLRQLQSGAHAWRGEYALALERGDEALERLERGSHAWLVAAAAVADARTRRLEHAEVLALCETLADLPVTAETQRFYAQAIVVTMPTLLWHGGPELVNRLFARLDEIAEVAGDDPVALAWINSARSWRTMSEGDVAASLVLDAKAGEYFEAVGDLRHACQQHANVGYHELMLGAFARSEQSLTDAIETATKIGLHQVTTQAQHNLGLALCFQGRIDEARAVEQQALDAFVAQGNRRLEAGSNNYLAIIELAAGAFDRAEAHARRAMALTTDEPASLSYCQGTLSRVLLAAGNAAGALAESTAAMHLIQTYGSPEEGELAIRRAHAAALAANGRYEEAETVRAVARARLAELAGKIGDPTWRASYLAANELG